MTTTPLPVVVLNALGQGHAYWPPLIDALSPRRVLVWEAPEATPSGGLAGLDDHVADVLALLRAQDIDGCHLVGWCTGAKVALTVGLHRPDAVRSMAFLNASFRHTGGDPQVDTVYERQLEAMCELLVARPNVAGRMLRVFTAGLFEPAAGEPGAEAWPLEAERRKPFADSQSVVTYARQLVDYWSKDPTIDAAAVKVPVLFLSGEADTIVSVAAHRVAAARFADAQHVTVPAGSHYMMFDRAAEVAAYVEAVASAAE